MNQKEIKSLQTKLKHYPQLHEKYPITKIIIEAIDALIDMNAPDDLIAPWYRSIRSFIYDIEKEIERIEGQYKSQ